MTKNDPSVQVIDRWPLHDAKARLSELVRAADQAPQYVTVHGREAVVVLSIDEYRRLNPERTGRALIEAMRACPVPDFTFESLSVCSPVRDVDL